MRDQDLIGHKVEHEKTKQRGVIQNISGKFISVDFDGEIRKFPYPDAFSSTLMIDDPKIQDDLDTYGFSVKLPRNRIPIYSVTIGNSGGGSENCVLYC